MLGTAIALAAEKFSNKTDKGGEPYVLHLLYVMEGMDTHDEKIVAVLHDVIEDTDVTAEDLLKMGFSRSLVRSIELLTHLPEDDYMTYVRRLAMDPIAKKVKKRDLEHNTQLSRMKGLRQKDFERLQTYHTAYAYLKN